MKDELASPDTPLSVRDWIADPPSWVEVRPTASLLPIDAVAELGAGETAAITLAVELNADLLLMDDRRGVTAALQRGLRVTGTMAYWPVQQDTELFSISPTHSTASNRPTSAIGRKPWTVA